MSLKDKMAPRSVKATPVAQTFIQTKTPDDRKKTSIRLSKELHRRARSYAVAHDMYLEDLIAQGLEWRISQ